jgi:hypothetical protein
MSMPDDLCKTCGRRFDSPYRVYDEHGKILYGCVDECHTGQLTSFTSKEFHAKGKKIRAASKKMLSRKSNPGSGKGFTFHGAFSSKILAKRREKEIPGSFIVEKDNRFYILKPKRLSPVRATNSKGRSRNPKSGWTLIYDKITRIEGTKGSDSLYPGQKFFHNFKKPYPSMYGSSDKKKLLITNE